MSLCTTMPFFSDRSCQPERWRTDDNQSCMQYSSVGGVRPCTRRIRNIPSLSHNLHFTSCLINSTRSIAAYLTVAVLPCTHTHTPNLPLTCTSNAFLCVATEENGVLSSNSPYYTPIKSTAMYKRRRRRRAPGARRQAQFFVIASFYYAPVCALRSVSLKVFSDMPFNCADGRARARALPLSRYCRIDGVGVVGGGGN